MDIFKLFNREKSYIINDQDDTVECDDICQLLVQLTKLIAELKSDEKYSRFYISKEEEIEILQVNIESLTLIVPNAYDIMDVFDFRDVKFNGYRSFFNIIKICLRNIDSSLRKTLQFKFFLKQIENQWSDYSKCLIQLTVMSKCLLQMMLSRKSSYNLFLEKSDDEEIYLKMMSYYETLSVDAFYGYCLGFYLCESCQLMAKVLCSLQLGLGQAMSVPKSDFEVFISTVINSTHSLFLENKRGSQMSSLYRQATVTFCKQFWNLVDHPILRRWMHLVLPNLKVIKQITLQPIVIHIPVADGSDDIIKISPPVAHSGYSDVFIRLLSHKLREGMEWSQEISTEKNREPLSKCILIHCHGGGFVAQSSQSHDGYLRQWAIDLDCPIVSIDYSHAPENPFPRAHEECFYAYCWVLRNLKQFGCESDCRVVICGDSAGGNLALGCVIRALQLNIRLPDGIFAAYPAALVDFIPSPSRIMGIFDPILPFGVLARCLLGYIGVNEDNLVKSINDSSAESVELISDESLNKTKASFLDRDAFDGIGPKIFYSKKEAVSLIRLLESVDISRNGIMSPFLADDDVLKRFPPLCVVASEFDPLLDDSVELCKKIDKAGGQFVHLRVMAGLPHGFLSMSSPVSRECYNANRVCVELIGEFLSGKYK